MKKGQNLRLTNEELEELLLATNSFYDCPTEYEKDRLRAAYRAVEEQTVQDIQRAGGITQWYEGGK